MVINMKILITGATSGIAYETALKLLEQNNFIYFCTHTEEEKYLLKEKLANKSNAKVYKLDVCNENDLKLLDILDYDVFWSHAGIGNGGAVLGISLDTIRKNYEVNVLKNIAVIKRAYENMCHKNIEGKIFVTSSLAAYLPLTYLGAYTSSKAALSSLCYTMNKELKLIGSNISLTLIELGAYHTGFNQVMIDNKERFLKPASTFYLYKDKVTKKQNNLFNLIEKKTLAAVSTKLTKQISKKNPKFLIRTPIIQRLLVKLYIIFLR